jgi:hypothetical protein
MNAFNVAVGSLFQDPNLVTPVLYYSILGQEKRVAVITHKPDDFHVMGDSIIATPTLVLDVALSACPDIVPGEKFVIDGKAFIVQGEIKRDSNNLTARVGLCAI